MRIKLSKGCWLVITAIILMGCSFEKIGQNAGKGLKSLQPSVDSIGRSLVNTIREELTKDSSRKDLQHFIDSLLIPVKNTTGSVRDSFINHQTLIWADSLLQTFTGQRLLENLQILQASLVGKTKADIFEIESSVNPLLKEVLAEVLGDTTRAKLGLLRDDLLGPKTGNAINRIIDTAVTHIVDSSLARFSKRLRSDIDPIVQGDISFIRKNAVILLVTLAVLAAIIITLIWQNRKKYLQMVVLLTKQIHDIPNQEVYDTLTKRIKNDAVTTGLEPKLREVLRDNGLLSSDSWKKNISQE